MTALRIVLALDLGVTGAGVIHHDGRLLSFSTCPASTMGPWAGAALMRRSSRNSFSSRARARLSSKRWARTGRGRCRRFRLWPRQGSR